MSQNLARLLLAAFAIPAPPPTAPTLAASAVVGSEMSLSIERNPNLVGSVAWSLQSGALPDGITLDGATGRLSGIPTEPDTYVFTVRQTDTVPTTFDVVVTFRTQYQQASITNASLPGTFVGVDYSEPITTAGLSGEISFAITSGALPGGTLLTDGVIQGVPESDATFTFTVTATDEYANSASKSLAIVVAPEPVEEIPEGSEPAITTSQLTAGTRGKPYSVTIGTVNLVAPIAWSIVSGALPAGLSLSGGTVSGTPTVTGSFSVTLRATGAQGSTATRTIPLTINAATLSLTPASLPDARENKAYSADVNASGGYGGVSFTKHSGTIPPGLTLTSSSGNIKGTPTTSGNFTFAIRATDGFGNTSTRSYTVTVVAAATLSVQWQMTSTASASASVLKVNDEGRLRTVTFVVDGGFLGDDSTNYVSRFIISNRETTKIKITLQNYRIPSSLEETRWKVRSVNVTSPATLYATGYNSAGTAVLERLY